MRGVLEEASSTSSGRRTHALTIMESKVTDTGLLDLLASQKSEGCSRLVISSSIAMLYALTAKTVTESCELLGRE